jgi:hypothetical protein
LNQLDKILAMASAGRNDFNAVMTMTSLAFGGLLPMKWFLPYPTHRSALADILPRAKLQIGYKFKKSQCDNSRGKVQCITSVR